MKFLFFVAASASLAVLFQNCGKIDIQTPAAVFSSNAKSGTSSICLPDGYTLDSFFITNINIKATAAGLQADTDGDGLSDSEETTLGFNPAQRRSAGKVLDAICNDLDYGVSCADFTLSCDSKQNNFGLNECDTLALNLNQSIQVGAGIDSDKDGIPDYLEIRINSFPNLNDSFNDLDFDLNNTIMEAERGTSVRNSNNNIQESQTVQVSKTKLQSNADCTGEYWRIDVLNLPVMPVAAFKDATVGAGDLSHNQNENIIMTFLKIKPATNGAAASKTFSGIQRINYDSNNVDRKFSVDQSKLLFTGDVEQ